MPSKNAMHQLQPRHARCGLPIAFLFSAPFIFATETLVNDDAKMQLHTPLLCSTDAVLYDINPPDVHLLGLLDVLPGAPVPVLLLPLVPGVVSPIMPPVLVLVTTIRHDQIFYLKQIMFPARISAFELRSMALLSEL